MGSSLIGGLYFGTRSLDGCLVLLSILFSALTMLWDFSFSLDIGAVGSPEDDDSMVLSAKLLTDTWSSLSFENPSPFLVGSFAAFAKHRSYDSSILFSSWVRFDLFPFLHFWLNL